jgi:hypothetical protein
MKMQNSIIELFYVSYTELMRQPFKKLRDYQDIDKLIRWHGSNENPPFLSTRLASFNGRSTPSGMTQRTPLQIGT